MQFQTPVINNSFSLSSLLLLSFFSLFHSRQWLAWTDNVQLSSYPHPQSLDSTSTNICCVQSGFGHGGEGVDAEVKPISMQIVMTSCVPPSSSFFFSLLVELPGGCWEGCLNSEWVSVTDKLLSSQIPTEDQPENKMCTNEHSYLNTQKYTHTVYKPGLKSPYF